MQKNVTHETGALNSPSGDGRRWCVDFTNGYFDNIRFL